MVGRAEQFVNQMSLKEIGAIQTIVDARRLVLQEKDASLYLSGDRVEFTSEGYEFTGTVMESKNASVKINVDDVKHAGTIETFNAVWWLRSERISRSKSLAPTKLSLDTDLKK